MTSFLLCMWTWYDCHVIMMTSLPLLQFIDLVRNIIHSYTMNFAESALYSGMSSPSCTCTVHVLVVLYRVGPFPEIKSRENYGCGAG